ncbi:MAG: FtsX-like permease family protein [Cyclobacteriaceae bacterium]
MIRNHLLSFFRNLSRNKGYAFINISGLAVGFAAAFLISIYVYQEYTYDRHHNGYEKIYRFSAPNFAFSSIAHLKHLEENVAGVESWVSVQPTPSGTLTVGEDGFVEENTYYVTEDYFKVFPQELLFGNSGNALENPSSIVITESLSRKIFGKENPVGLQVKLSSRGPAESYTITGVMKDTPVNAYLKYSILARLKTEFETDPDNFNYTVAHCFFRSAAPLDLQQFQDQSDETFTRRVYELYGSGMSFEEYFEATRKHRPRVLNIADVHLSKSLLFEASPAGRPLYLKIFIGIAAFIILLAAINYINLSTAQASRRAKEIGIRKVLGSVRSNLISGFLSESLMLSVLSLITGIFLAALLLEVITSIGFKAFNVSVFDFKQLLAGIAIVSVLTGVGAGIYPAFYLSGFVPALVLKGNHTTVRGKSLSRNFLVIFQFAVSIILTIFSIFVYQQLNYGINKDPGFQKDQVLVLDNSKGQLGESDEAFRNELLSLSSVTNASFSQYSMIDRLALTGLQNLDSTEQYLRTYYKFVDSKFIETMGFELREGRNFNPSIESDISTIIINERMKEEIGGEVIGKMFNGGNLGEKISIIGVIKDFHFQDMSQEIQPAAFFFREGGNQVNIRVSEANSQSIAEIEAVWGRFTNEPFDFYFFDQRFNELFKSEKTLSQIITIFTSLSVFIAFLGFAGLISYQLDKRIKEIGIRKVLGATVGQILKLFSVEFSRLAIVSFLIGAPVAWFVTTEWLKSFAYRVDVGILPFLLAGIGGFLLILSIIILRTRGKANANPVETLRSE